MLSSYLPHGAHMEERLVFFQEPRLPCFVISKSTVVLMMSYGLAPVVQLMTDNFQTTAFFLCV